jgi:hypothetical protein
LDGGWFGFPLPLLGAFAGLSSRVKEFEEKKVRIWTLGKDRDLLKIQ